MTTDIRTHLHDPKHLETLYRGDKVAFKRAFLALYPDVAEQPVAQCWKERLDHETTGISWGSSNELAFVVIAGLLAGTIAKVPEILPVDADFFYTRNIGFIVFPFLTAFFAWKNGIKPLHFAIISVATALALVFINALPGDPEYGADSDTLILACIHLPLFLWAVLGYTFIGGDRSELNGRIDFLRYNGDLMVMTTLILITGALLTGMTFALFELIDISIADFYMEYVVVYGLAAAPMVGTYVVQRNPQLVNAVSPVIAKIFSPLVLITLAIYLLAMLSSGKDPYNDREFLLTFNILLIGVMAIILFSVAGSARSIPGRASTAVLLSLAVLTILVNGVALLAILFRISEWGFTPNRLAVLGGNVLILTNLLLVTYHLARAVGSNTSLEPVERSIARYLPVYSVWTAIVVFVFPFVFWVPVTSQFIEGSS